MGELLNGVDVFVAAVEAGSFSEAADRLNLSRSAVGKTIARVEERLGTRLFHRTTRARSLTEDGQLYYERCLKALEELRAAEQALESGRSEATGRLRVSLPLVFGRECVAPVLWRLAGRHPRLGLDLIFTDRPVDLVEDGVDLAIRIGPPGNDASVMARTIARLTMILCAAPTYLANHGTPTGLDDLAEHTTLAYMRSGWVKPWYFPENDSPLPREVIPEGRFRFTDIGAIADAAVAGLGLAWLPQWLIQDHLRAGRLVPLTEGFPPLISEARALWPQAPWLPTRVRLAIDTLVAELGERADL